MLKKPGAIVERHIESLHVYILQFYSYAFYSRRAVTLLSFLVISLGHFRQIGPKMTQTINKMLVGIKYFSYKH